jgi:hypothetical protein
MFMGVIPRRMGMRRIAGIRSSNSCRLPNIGNPCELNLPLDEATLVPGSKYFPEYGKSLGITRHKIDFKNFELSINNWMSSTMLSAPNCGMVKS